MRDRFSDTSKQIFDNPEFEEIQNAIGQLEEIIRNARGRHHPRRSSDENGGGVNSPHDPDQKRDDGQAQTSATDATATSTSVEAVKKDTSTDIHKTCGDSDGANAININNNNIIIPRAKAKSNGIGKHGRSNSHNNIVNDIAAINKSDKQNNKFVIIRSNSNGANHMKSASSAIASYLRRQHSLAASSSPTSGTTTTTAIIHSPTSAETRTKRRNSCSSINDDRRANNVRPRGLYIKANGISRKSSTKALSASATAHHTSQLKGTATVSTETTRSGSKTPEITITPGSEVLGGDLVETELPERLLLSSAGSRVVGVEGERVSPEDLPDSGCTGLLDEDDEDSCSLIRLGSGSNAGDPVHAGGAAASAHINSHPGISGGGISSDRGSGGGDRDSGGGSVASSGTGGYQRSNSIVDTKEVIYASIQKPKSSVNVNGNELPSPVYSQLTFQQQQQTLLHVDGPLDGSPYAVVNPLVKQKAFADSGISVDQMKDLDRLLNALVQEADSIDIPYHARQDSLPFSYTAPPGPPPASAPAQLSGPKRSPYGHEGGVGTSGGGIRYGSAAAGSSSSTSYQQQKSHHHHHQSQYGTSVPIPISTSGGGGGSRYRGLEHSHSTPGSRLSSSSVPSQSYHHRQQVPPQYYQHQSSIEDQILNPEPISSYSRSISRQPSISGSNKAVGSSSRVGARDSDQQGYRVRPSLSSTSFNASAYGNGTATSGMSVRRIRSQSADGRRDTERDEDADEWLARQMKRLQEKRASKNAPSSNLIAELKRALPAATAGGNTAGATPSAIANAAGGTERSYEQSRVQSSISEYRPYSSTAREEVSAASSVMLGATPVLMGGGGRRSHVSYSSEDDDDVELEMYQRGRRIQRHYSESAYDRAMTSASSTRAPSQLSNVVETPFPTCPPTPYFNRPVSPGKPPRSPKGIRRQISSSSVPVLQEIPSRMERAQTPVNPRPVYMVDSEVKFAQDLSEHWYKPVATREETVAALVNQGPGAFIIRNSNSFPGAFGLAVKVSDTAGEKGIRHFLVEPTRFGVRLRGSSLEPVFSSLSALVYAHSIEALALPTTLALPNFDILPKSSQSTTALLLRQGAACQLLFLGITSVECLTGDEAIHRGITQISGKSPIPISLRLSKHGLTLTDVFRKQFFRLHFALNDISYSSLVPGRSVAYGKEVKQVFGIVARAPRAIENSVIVLAELEHGQPANAIVSFILRVIAWQH